VSPADAPIRILLVEDSDVYRDSLIFLLGTREDLQIVAAVADGGAAVRAWRQHLPDVVVLDYRLPDVDGAVVAEDLGGSAIVFLSASAGQEEYDAASSAGAALVRKDEGIEALVRAVRTAAGR
jgi:DNA-binding NarL/FixJ family response regulator